MKDVAFLAKILNILPILISGYIFDYTEPRKNEVKYHFYLIRVNF